jgi:D-2-hydroxyacid dehydrogenase (NADP+)
MELQRIVVHDSLERICAPSSFADALRDRLPVPVAGGDVTLGPTDAVVTFGDDPAIHESGWVHGVRAGYDAFDLAAYEAAGTRLTNSSGIHGDTVPETVIGYLFSLARRLHYYRDNEAAAEWTRPEYDVPFTLGGEQVCVVGLGTIGRGVAERASALGMDVVGVRRSGDPVPGVARVYDPEALLDAVADARFVVLACPLTSETEGLVDETVLAAMREDAYLVNVARGEVVEEVTLARALELGAIAGAALDAFRREPLPPDHPFWKQPQTIVTPHASWMTGRYHEDVADLVAENVGRLRRGEGLKNQVV